MARERQRRCRNQKTIRQLPNQKAHRKDGIPGEAYEAIRKQLTQHLRILMGEILHWENPPNKWTEGAIVHIYKNEGGKQDCASYRPICITQITYEIWPSLIVHRIAQIAHIVTNNTQYGYETRISAIGAIAKIESYLEQKQENTHTTHGPIKSIWYHRSNTPVGKTIQEIPTNRYDTTYTAGRENINLLANTQGKYGGPHSSK